MVRILNRIATRMAMLAALMTVITMFVGLAAYYAAMYYRFTSVSQHMPPRARAELQSLINAHQRGSDRYYEVYNRFGGNGPGITDLGFIGTIGLISMLVGGAIAIVLARRISRPITAVAHAAAQVSAGNRSVRVAQGGMSGETGELIESFNRMAADIEAYERERTVLTAGIAHELRTPLTILTGRLHGLADGIIDPTTGEASRLLRQVEHLSRLVEDLRTLAHADAGELSLNMGRLDVQDVVRRAVADLRPSAEAQGVEILETYAPAFVAGDPLRLTQICTNILTNAIKHSASGSRIGISLYVQHRHAVVSMIDEGPGFAPEDEHRLFIPFWRAGTDKHAGRAGSGMGLALAIKLAEAHNGRIVAKNRSDRTGACFSIWIPAIP
jgi:signal transduction histidine kinase